MSNTPSLKACASCGTSRGNVRNGWAFALRDGTAYACTCPECPEVGEPIRREQGARGVRFLAVVDATAPGAVKRVQRKRRFDTLEDARAWVAEVRAEVAASGVYAPREVETVRELAERWLTTRRDVREVSHLGYRTALRSVLEYLGDKSVTSVRVGDIEAYMSWALEQGGKQKITTPDGVVQGKPLSPRSVRYALVALAQAFDLAVREEALTRNVVRLAKQPRQRRAGGKELPHWDRDTMLRFAAAADRDPLAAAWRLSLSGITRSEVHGLRWGDVDLNAGTVTIVQGRVALQRGETVTDEPKSAQRRRTVPVEQIWPGTVAALRTLKAKQAADRLAAGGAWADRDGLVLVDALGNPMHPDAYSDAFRRIVRTEGLPPIRLHALRHSIAFELIRVGVPPTDGAALLGHRVEVFMSVYLPEGGVTGVRNASARLAASFAEARGIA